MDEDPRAVRFDFDVIERAVQEERGEPARTATDKLGNFGSGKGRALGVLRVAFQESIRSVVRARNRAEPELRDRLGDLGHSAMRALELKVESLAWPHVRR
jgi:hypothetical protein